MIESGIACVVLAGRSRAQIVSRRMQPLRRNLARTTGAFLIATAGMFHSHAMHGAMPVSTDAVVVRSDWKAGERYRYRVVWQREASGHPGTAAPAASRSANNELIRAMNHQLSGEVVVTVTRLTDNGYVLRWEPAIPAPLPLPGQPDAATLGSRLKDFSLTLPMTLRLNRGEGGFEIEYSDAVILRLKLLDELRRLTAATESPIDCVADTSIQDTIICRMLGSNEAAMTLLQPTVAALFACSGIRVDPSRPQDWSVPHANPQIAEAVMIRYHEEVIDFRAPAPTLRVRRNTSPDQEQLHSWMRQRMAGSPEDLIRETVDKFTYASTLECTMESATGWPLRIEDRTTGGSSGYNAAESVHFERIEPPLKSRRSD